MNTKKYRKRNKKSSSIYDLGGVVNTGIAGLSGVMGVASSFIDNAKIEDTEPLKKDIESSSKKVYNISSIDDAFNAWNTLPTYKEVSSRDIRGSSIGEQLLNTGKGIISGASAGAQIGGDLGGIIGGAVGLLSGIGGMVTGNVKAKKEKERIDLLQDQGETRARGNVLTGLENTVDLQNLNYQLNYSKFGGPLHTKGGVFDSGLMFIDEGYTHEENPYGGIQISVDPEGNPNLVEEGEIVLKGNNGQQYVFSNSVYAKEDILKQFGLPKKYSNASFAYIAEKISKEELETPNDPISRRSLDDKMNKLIYAQEMIKAKRNKNKNKIGTNVFNTGGATPSAGFIEKPAVDALEEALYKKFKIDQEQGESSAASQAAATEVDKVAARMTPVVSSSMRKDTNKILGIGSGRTDFSSALTPSSTNVVSDAMRKDMNKILEIGTNTSVSPNAFTPKITPTESTLTDPMKALQIGTNTDISKSALQNIASSSFVRNPVSSNGTFSSTAGSGSSVKSSTDSVSVSGSGSGIGSGSSVTELLRMAPILGSAYNMLFENRKPDFTGANLMANQAARVENIPISTPILSDYIAPKPFDKSFYMNKMQGSHAAALRSLQNTAGNRGQAMSGILGADYNFNSKLGDLARQAEEYNREDALKVADFNRATNTQNADTLLRNNNQRLQREELLGSLRTKEATLRDAAIAAVGAARSNNRTNFFNNLGALGKENFIFEMLESNPELLASIDKKGTLSQKTNRKKGGVLLTKNNKRKHA